MPGVDVFDRLAHEYDQVVRPASSALSCRARDAATATAEGWVGVGIGAGTGRFALRLGALLGIEPSRPTARRGLRTVQAVGEHLPLPDSRFDFALLVTVVSFVADVLSLLRETARILKSGGRVVIGLIDLNTSLGRLYESRHESNPFYRHARFCKASEIIGMLGRIGFREPRAFQVMIGLPGEAPNGDVAVRPCYGGGGFVGVGAVWTASLSPPES